MKKNAIYPGTFDPITYGHIDVIKKALKIVDHVIVAISDGNYKNHFFDINERIEIVKKALFKDLNLKKNKIEVISFNSLTTSLCLKISLITSSIPLPVASVLPTIPPLCNGFPVTQPL